MLDDDDTLDPKQLGRSKEEEGRFTLTPAERKLARQTSNVGKMLGRGPPEQRQSNLPGPSENPFEREPKGPLSANYAKGGMIKHGSATRVSCKGKVK